MANQSLGLVEANLLSAFNASVVDANLTEEKYHEARKLLRSQFESKKWRAVVPMIPLPLPGDWVAPLKKMSVETIADLRALKAQGRIEIFGNIESLDDLKSTSEQPAGTPAAAAQQSVLIAGLAKSGTTALFYKIKEVMPADTYCMFEPKQFDATEAAGKDSLLAKVLLVGTEPETFNHFKKKILIVRDPRDRIVSGALYRVFNAPEFCKNEAKVAEFVDALCKKEASPSSVSTLELIQLGDRLIGTEHLPLIADAVKTLVTFRRAHPDFFIYRYDDLVLGKFDELSRYLGIELSDEKPTVAAELSRVTRTQGSGDWQHWFAAEDVAYFRPLLESYMRELGYDDDWILASEPYIAPVHASEYVTQIVKDRIALDVRSTPPAAQRSAKTKGSDIKRRANAGPLARGITYCSGALRRLMGRG